ncbi:unnamed protein product, partial [Mesorhabditis belari]|uniref:Uncharacterized protein n=1 Tax=Mesorhabditis belari TaxID=2138241 RepID=A0A915FXQ7_9BILA
MEQPRNRQPKPVFTNEALSIIFDIVATNWIDYSTVVNKGSSQSNATRQKIYIKIFDRLQMERIPVEFTEEQLAKRISNDLSRLRKVLALEMETGAFAKPKIHLEVLEKILREEMGSQIPNWTNASSIEKLLRITSEQDESYQSIPNIEMKFEALEESENSLSYESPTTIDPIEPSKKKGKQELVQEEQLNEEILKDKKDFWEARRRAQLELIEFQREEHKAKMEMLVMKKRYYEAMISGKRDFI